MGLGFRVPGLGCRAWYLESMLGTEGWGFAGLEFAEVGWDIKASKV